MKKIIFTLILLVGFSTTNFSQNKKMMEKMKEKATELVEKLNNEIKAGDETLALSEAQKTKVMDIQTERLMELRKLGKSASKEDKKAMNKKYFQKIFKEVLTKEQLKARRKAKKDE